MSRDPVPLGEALGEVKTPAGGARPKEIVCLWKAWRTLAGPAVCAHVEPTSLRNGILRLRADSPVWATEVGYLSDHIRRSANEVLEAPVVREVRVWTGPGRVPQTVDGAGPSGASRRKKSTLEQRTEHSDPQMALRAAYEAWRRRQSTPRRGASRPIKRENGLLE